MDLIARAFYELHFEVAFLKKRADEFQDFFASIMELAHPADFQRVRPWGNLGDRKNDGYLRSERTLFQVYAPNDLKSADTVRKIGEDFSEALPYWKAHFSTWAFVHNSQQGVGPEVAKKLMELHASHPELKVLQWGFHELRARVFRLSEPDLAWLFGPAPTSRGMDSLGIPDLRPILEQVPRLPAPAEADLRPVPPDKLQRNLLSDHVATLLKAGMRRATLVGRYFDARPNPTERDAIAQAFRVKYEDLRRASVAPDDIFVALQKYVDSAAMVPAHRQEAVLAVLAYFFEECDIFERMPQQVGP
ncbi:ABC-three component system protein [Pyxidicoccus sp. 3LG]